METAQEKLTRILQQNSARQRKHYLKNADKLKSNRKLKYKAMTDALKANTIQPPDLYEIPEQPAQQTRRGKKPAEVTWPRPYNPRLQYNTYQQIIALIPAADVKQYGSQIKTLFQILDDTTQFKKTIQNAQTVIDAIKNSKKKDGTAYSKNSQKAYMQALLKLITQLNIPIDEVNAAKYLFQFNVYRLDSSDVTAHKKATEKFMKFVNYLKLVEDHFGADSKEYLMAKMYDEFTLRDDYCLKIVHTLAETKSELQNFLVLPESEAEPLTLQINQYKTVKKYGKITEKLSDGLSQIIRAYITKHKIAYGSNLFGKSKTNSTFVSDFNKKMGLTGYSITKYRNMKSSEIPLVGSNDERVKISEKMKHSPVMSLHYIRTLLD